VTKPKRRQRKCQWCREWFTPARRGRPARYCSPSCRQRAYERRRLEKADQDNASAALAQDLAEAKQLAARAVRRRLAELEAENKDLRTQLELERSYNQPPAQRADDH
jgi:hypothetical protein